MPLTSYEQTIIDHSTNDYTTLGKFQLGQDDERIPPSQGGLQWFPNINKWNIEEIQRENERMTMKPSSQWSVERIMDFYRVLEQVSMERQRGRSDARYQFTMLPLNIVTNAANKIFGFNNWNSRVLEGSEKLMSYQKEDKSSDDRYTVTFTLEVELKLKDGTTVVRKGLGKAENAPSLSLAFGKCRKEAMTHGLKLCFYGLIGLLVEYQHKIKAGYFIKYEGNN